MTVVFCVLFQSKNALKHILQKCTHLEALEPLLPDAPPNILKYVVCQFAKVLPHDSKARRNFVTSGGLKKVQEIKADPGSALHEYINTINNCYPEEIVRYVNRTLCHSEAECRCCCRTVAFLAHGLCIVSRLGAWKRAQSAGQVTSSFP